MPPKAKLTKDKETENEPATDGVAEPGGISAILDLLRIIQKDPRIWTNSRKKIGS